MLRLFTDHPRSVGESYLEHFAFACAFGARMAAGGLACFVHGALPFLFQTTGSRTVLALHERMMRVRAAVIRRSGAPEPEYLI
ncbi:MAG: hypothetical protein JO021_17450 [Alphaproteobacteria bacterium]|nr:hypothetical protein [Alphaproteobacteria bacterium]